MRLTLTATASKPGLLRFILQHNGTAAQGEPSSAPPASARGLLNTVAANDLARANFTGTLALRPAAANGSNEAAGAATLCIADAADMVLHAVAQDQEGQYAGRWPNNSTLTRCVFVGWGDLWFVCVVQYKTHTAAAAVALLSTTAQANIHPITTTTTNTNIKQRPSAGRAGDFRGVVRAGGVPGVAAA
jgi:hypothetical protein